MNREARRRTAVAALPLLLAGVSAGCTGEDPERPAAPIPTSAPSSEAPPAEPADARLRTKVGAVTGELRKARRREVARRVARTVDRWLVAAWVGEDDPPRRFGRRAFPSFTRDAWRQAKRDRNLLSLASLADRVDGIHVRRRDVTVDMLGAGGHPAGATARFRLVLVTSGQAERRVAVRGRLDLSPRGDGRWRIFGYDVARDVVPADRADRRGRGRDRGGKGKDR